jgi:quercetin dioxygenase-like cupin family protein
MSGLGQIDAQPCGRRCQVCGRVFNRAPICRLPPHPDLCSKDLANIPGKEGVMMIVDYPPGSVDPIHRHNTHAFVYVLEGSIVMQVRGGKEVTLTPGQTF